MKKVHPLVLSSLFSIVAVSWLFAQDPTAKETVVPPGNAERGKALFVEKGCYQCHSAGQTKLPAVELEPRLVIELGGAIHENWTRDDYAKSIMSPNHLIAEEYRIAMIRLGDHFKAENSPMPQFTELLKVSELIDLATFLDGLSD